MSNMAELRSSHIRIRALPKLLRPITLISPAVGGLFFGLMGIKDAGLPLYSSLPLLFLSGFILAMTNAASNIMNQVFDVDIDRLHPIKKSRPVAAGEIKSTDALSTAIFLMILVIGLSAVFFKTTYVLSLTVIILFAWLYNCPPFSLKRRFVLSNIALAAPRGGLGITCAYSAFANPFNPIMYVAMIYFALYVFGTNTLKDFADEPYDKISGVRNFVTVWGIEKASKFVACFTVIPFLFLLAAAQFVNISTISFAPMLFSFGMLYFLFRQAERKSIEGNSFLWLLFYLQLSVMLILFALPRII